MTTQADVIAAFLDADALRDRAAFDLISNLNEDSLRSLWKAINVRLLDFPQLPPQATEGILKGPWLK